MLHWHSNYNLFSVLYIFSTIRPLETKLLFQYKTEILVRFARKVIGQRSCVQWYRFCLYDFSMFRLCGISFFLIYYLDVLYVMETISPIYIKIIWCQKAGSIINIKLLYVFTIQRSFFIVNFIYVVNFIKLNYMYFSCKIYKLWYLTCFLHFVSCYCFSKMGKTIMFTIVHLSKLFM